MADRTQETKLININSEEEEEEEEEEVTPPRAKQERTSGGKYKGKMQQALQAPNVGDDGDSSYKYPGYKNRQRASFDGAPLSPSPNPEASGTFGSSSSFIFVSQPLFHLLSTDPLAQARAQRQEDLLKAAQARRKTKEKKKAFGEQLKGVLSYLPFRTSHLAGFD